MGADTKIPWATHTLNFWEGAPRRVTAVSTWLQADKWDREARASGVRPRIFVNSLSDFFDPEVSAEVRAKALQVMHRCTSCDFLLLTKRPELWRQLMGDVVARLTLLGEDVSWLYDWRDGKTPANIWVGTTVENQARADERIPALLAIPARVRFLSMEPLLGPVDLAYTCFNGSDSYGTMPGLHWVICGGESGPNARDFCVDYAADLLGQCRRAGVPFFMKQLGRRPVTTNANLYEFEDTTELTAYGEFAAGARIGLEDKAKGEDMAEWPTEWRVREFPHGEGE